MNISTSKPNLSYYPCVDFLRGLGALVILIWHYHHFYFEKPYFSPENGNPVWDYGRQPFYDLFLPFFHYGYWSVQFFWLLSGFVFAFVYLGKNINFRDFFILRFSRLYPLHFITLVSIAVLQWVSFRLFHRFQVLGINDAYHFALNLFFAQHWGFQSGYSFNSPSWSISVEELIYYTFWLVTIRLGFRSIRGNIILILICLMLSPKLGNISWAGFYFFFGALIFLIKNSIKEHKNVLYLVAGLIGVSVIGFLLVNTAFGALETLGIGFLLKRIDAVKRVFDNIGYSGAFGALVICAAYIDRVNVLVRARKIFMFTGGLTYSTYMLHLPIQVLILILWDYFGLSRGIFDHKMVFVSFIIGMIFIGRLSYVFIERPAQNYIRSKYLSKT